MLQLLETYTSTTTDQNWLFWMTTALIICIGVYAILMSAMFISEVRKHAEKTGSSYGEAVRYVFSHSDTVTPGVSGKEKHVERL